MLTYELYRLTQQFVAKIDRAYRFSLGGKLVDSLNEIIKLTSLTNNITQNFTNLKLIGTGLILS